MAFRFDTFRHLFSGHKPEPVQPSFTPASGQEVKPTGVAMLGTEGDVAKQQIDIAAAPISELKRHDQALIQRLNEITKDGHFSGEAFELAAKIGRLHNAIADRTNGLEVDPSSRAMFLNSPVQQSMDVANQLRLQQAEFYRDLSALSATDFANSPNLSVELRSRAEEWNTARAEAIERSAGDAYLWFPKPISEQEMEQLIWDRQNTMEAASSSLSHGHSETRLDAAFKSETAEPNEQEMDEAEGRYVLENYLEQRYLPDLSSEEEKPSEKSYSPRELRQAARLVDRDIAEPQTQHPNLNSKQLLAIVQEQDRASLAATAPNTSLDIESSEAAFSLLIDQEKSIREEWQRDLESGHHNQHDLETYFAGKIDQHNTLIELAVEANPKLQETLPPQINYEQLRSEIQQHIQQQPQAPAQAMEMAI